MAPKVQALKERHAIVDHINYFGFALSGLEDDDK